MSAYRFRSSFGRSLGALCPALFVLTTGCTSGQIGGEIENTDRDEPGEVGADNCGEAGRTPIDLDEATSIGITAQEVIDAVSGTHETSLAWGIEPTELDATLTPEPGESMVTIEVVPRPETAALLEWTIDQSDAEGGNTLIGLEDGLCADEIQVIADVTISSENGAFDDTFEVTFHAKNTNVVSGEAALVPGELEGSFDVSTEGNGEPVQTELSLNFAFGTVSGEIRGVWQEVFGDPNGDEPAASGGWISYGRFPADGCEEGSLIGEETTLGSAILEGVSSETEFDFSWQGGEKTTLTVDPAVSKLCLVEDDYTGTSTVVGPITASLATADGRVDANWELELRAELQGEEVTSVFIRSQSDREFGYAAEDFEAATGISGVETDATDLGFDFSYEISLTGETTSGTLTVLQLVIPDCARPGYEPEVVETPDGGSGVPGCEGTQFVEVETATFVSTSTPPSE